MYDPPPTPPKKRRRLRRRLTVAAVVLAAALAALPRVLSMPFARRALLLQVNYAIRPNRVELAALRLSWFGPIRASGLVLRDRTGKPVVAAERATIDHGLVPLLLTRPRALGVTLDGAALDLERRADGSIDLADALAPPRGKPEESKKPGPGFTLRITRGTLRLRSPELIEPLTADRMALTLSVPPAATGPTTWTLGLAKQAEDGPATLALTGRLDPRGDAADLDLTARITSWPLAAGSAGVEARGRITGALTVRRHAGRLASDGAATLAGLAVAGPALAGDTLRLDRVESRWDVGRSAEGWSVRRLDVRSPVGTLAQVEDAGGPGTGAAWILRGQLDLAAIAAQLPHALRLREEMALERGRARFEAREQAEGGRRLWQIDADLSDLAARHQGRLVALEHPPSCTARLHQGESGLALETLNVKAPFLNAEGKGDLERGIAVVAAVDLDRLRRELASWVDLGGLQLAGLCQVSADYRREPGGYVARMAVEGQDLLVAGPTSEPIRRDAARFEGVVRGPMAPSGAPSGWASARFKLKSGPDDLDLKATRAAGIALALTAAGPLSRAGADEGPPVKLALLGTYQPEADALAVEQLTVGHRYGTAQATGRIDDLKGRRRADLRGTVSPAWDAIEAALHESVEPTARLAGRARPFRLAGPLAAASLGELVRGLDAEAGLDLTEAQVFGLAFGPAPIVVRCRGGQVRVEPIATTVNGGRLDLRPEVQIGPAGEVTLALAPGSTIEQAEINAAVSDSLLSYVAPVLHRATAVRGKVSARIDRAEVPLGAPAGRPVAAAGRLVFHRVMYGPGPMMQELIGVTGLAEVPHLTLDQPLDFTIADRRVNQSGLAIAVRPGVTIEVVGSVGFDGSLALTAGLPVTSAMLGRVPGLEEILAGTRVELPIGGTFARPALDRTALRESLRGVGRTIMEKAAARGAPDLLQRGASELLQRLGGALEGPPPAGRGIPEPPKPGGMSGLGRDLLRELIPGRSAPPPGPPPEQPPNPE